MSSSSSSSSDDSDLKRFASVAVTAEQISDAAVAATSKRRRGAAVARGGKYDYSGGHDDDDGSTAPPALALWQRRLAEQLNQRLDSEVIYEHVEKPDQHGTGADEVTQLGIALFPKGPKVMDLVTATTVAATVPTKAKTRANLQKEKDDEHVRKRRCVEIAVSGEDVAAHALREAQRAARRATHQWATCSGGPPYPLLSDPTRDTHTADMAERARRLTG
ncbi:hypothetical protein RI054_09g47010 [Pseudoscourfieldia marina]